MCNETIHDDSPLLRANGKKIKPMSSDCIRTQITASLLKTNLVKKGPKRRELKAYSLRKYFDTNLASAGVHRDYIEYLMGHKTPTYNSIKSKGIEFLRNIYISSGLSIKPKTQITKTDMLKEIIRSLGMDPDKILVKEAFSQPHRTIVGKTNEEALRDALRNTIREVLKGEI